MKNLNYNNVRRLGLSALLIFAILQLLWTQQLDPIKNNYAKSEFQIAMRDGKKLFTAVYEPKDATKPYPIMLTRTPYSVAPYGVENYPSNLGPSEEFSRSGYIFAYQDVRGRMMSEGDFINMAPYRSNKNSPDDVDESSDACDTIDWLVKNVPNNNGKVGMWGISYPGFYAAAGAIDAHPALKAVSPQAPIMDWFLGDDFHHNGAFYLAHAFGFLSGFGRPRPKPTMHSERYFEYPTPDGYDFFLKMGPLSNVNEKYFKNDVPFWNDLMRHGDYDAFWQDRDLRPHLKNIKPAMMTVGGWFDAEDLFGSLNAYQAAESSSPGAYNTLVMGPWRHGGWAQSDSASLGSVHFGSDTGLFFRKEIELPFFEYFLKDTGKLGLPEAYVFLTGSNEWRREEKWPPAGARPKNLYFTGQGKLSWDRPDEDSAYDEYISDPSKPVPYIEGIVNGMMREYMVEDQRFASRRPDVLAYETETLRKDVVIAGPVIASLNVSTSGSDSDFVVKLIDVYPGDTPDNAPNPENVRMGGYQQLVRGEAFRGKFRNSFSNTEPFTPGHITSVKWKMPDIFHTFLKGHRIMVQVQSSWFPLVDRNPQQFVDIYNAKASDFIKATQKVHRSKNTPSFVTLYQMKQ